MVIQTRFTISCEVWPLPWRVVILKINLFRYFTLGRLQNFPFIAMALTSGVGVSVLGW